MDWKWLGGASGRTLEALETGPLTLTQLADKLQVSKPSILRALEPLVKEGLVNREDLRAGGTTQTLFSLQDFDIRWRRQDGISLRWQSIGHVPERFALVHQVATETARRDITNVMRTLEKTDGWRDVRHLIVYGSVARGDAGPTSDLDILVLLDREDRAMQETFRDALADPDLRFRHPPRLRFETVDDFVAGRTALAQEIDEDGLVIHGEPTGGGQVWRRLRKYKNTSS